LPRPQGLLVCGNKARPHFFSLVPISWRINAHTHFWFGFPDRQVLGKSLFQLTTNNTQA
jgi:hypothetical protein